VDMHAAEVCSGERSSSLCAAPSAAHAHQRELWFRVKCELVCVCSHACVCRPWRCRWSPVYNGLLINMNNARIRVRNRTNNTYPTGHEKTLPGPLISKLTLMSASGLVT
jgi:hypothetical protein